MTTRSIKFRRPVYYLTLITALAVLGVVICIANWETQTRFTFESSKVFTVVEMGPNEEVARDRARASADQVIEEYSEVIAPHRVVWTKVREHWDGEAVTIKFAVIYSVES